MLLGLLGRAILAAAAVAAVAAIVIVIHGMITPDKLRRKLKENGVKDALVKAIDECNNVISLEELESDRTIEVRGDSIDDCIEEYDTIYVY
ncbi:MAG: hypothetical protein J6A16_04920 [Oscillospiraceae bacterium]|nr:hypothetical protein [Oscillospiraceae bacterium]